MPLESTLGYLHPVWGPLLWTVMFPIFRLNSVQTFLCLQDSFEAGLAQGKSREEVAVNNEGVTRACGPGAGHSTTSVFPHGGPPKIRLFCLHPAAPLEEGQAGAAEVKASCPSALGSLHRDVLKLRQARSLRFSRAACGSKHPATIPQARIRRRHGAAPDK